MFFRITCLLKAYVVKEVMNCRKKCLLLGHVLVCDVVHLSHYGASKINWYICSVCLCDVVLQFRFDA